jgi:hypothetical protein
VQTAERSVFKTWGAEFAKAGGLMASFSGVGRKLKSGVRSPERINGPVLLVSGDDDQLWPSSYMAAEIMQRLHSSSHAFADEWLHYPNAGHGIGVAYDTLCKIDGQSLLALGRHAYRQRARCGGFLAAYFAVLAPCARPPTSVSNPRALRRPSVVAAAT